MKLFIFIFFLVLCLTPALFAQQDSTAVDSVLIKQLEQQMQVSGSDSTADGEVLSLGEKDADLDRMFEREVKEDANCS